MPAGHVKHDLFRLAYNVPSENIKFQFIIKTFKCVWISKELKWFRNNCLVCWACEVISKKGKCDNLCGYSNEGGKRDNLN